MKKGKSYRYLHSLCQEKNSWVGKNLQNVHSGKKTLNKITISIFVILASLLLAALPALSGSYLGFAFVRQNNYLFFILISILLYSYNIYLTVKNYFSIKILFLIFFVLMIGEFIEVFFALNHIFFNNLDKQYSIFK
ncbi:MAG: hypothetical protein WBA13_21350 [Microcoleaceae cyanobacterium]